ncbi:hypothetical protein KHQ81_06325 [Mycoplasmatota bacterium]|nr:hypothetical protein KHQ81_06325 [Mycoplasmatota bacterium]
MNDKTSLRRNRLTYFVIYMSEDELEDINPIVIGTLEEIRKNANTFHLLPKELFNSIDIFSKIFQLPRHTSDLFKIPFHLLTELNNMSHSIIFLPKYLVDTISNMESIIDYEGALVLYEEGCYDEAVKLDTKLRPILGIKSFGEFRSCSPMKIWSDLQDLFENGHSERIDIPNLDKFLSGKELNLLPAFFYTIQNDDFEKFMVQSQDVDHILEYVSGTLDNYNIRIKTMSAIKEKLSEDKTINKRLYETELKKNLNVNFKPLVVTLPGIPNIQTKRYRGDGLEDNYEIELLSIKNLGLYRAISRSAAYLELGYMGKELFDIIYKLEEHCKENISNKFIWKSMERIGDILASQLSGFELELLRNSKQISYFSELPFGLAILPGTTSPLNCYTPISGKGLTPLLRIYQSELSGVNDVLILDKCKIIIAECLKKDDSIRSYSDEGWSAIEKFWSIDEKIEIIREETNTVHRLKKFIKKNQDADILIVSAHGHYDTDRKITGILVGDELWFGNDNDFHVPEVVLLSACHVSPKGLGAINVSDLFFRNGAICVMGTLIPIHVQKNILLMNRLITYISEAMNGRTELDTLDRIWCHVVGTNAILEIIESSKKLKKWATQRNRGQSPLEKFMMNKSGVQLRPKHIYEDSIERLMEIAKEEKMEEYINAVIQSKGIFPESVFYILLGNPELVYFQLPKFMN